MEYENEYLKNIPLLFTNEGFGINSKDMRDRTFIEIYGYNGYPTINISDLSEGIVYIFRNEDLNKVALSNMIESSKPVYIRNTRIENFFFNATSHSNGFKTSTMKHLYEHAFSEEVVYTDTQAFWNHHNEIKIEKFSKFFDEPKDIWINRDKNPHYKIEMEKMKEMKEICHAALVKHSFKAFDLIYDDQFRVGIL